MTQKSLFPTPTAKPAADAIRVNIDGGARGNPGPAAYGVIVRDAKGEIIAELSDYLGIQTNNYAEYSGLLAALDFAGGRHGTHRGNRKIRPLTWCGSKPL